MRVFQTRLLWKYFASYFCFLMLPLVCLGFFVFNYFSNSLQKDVIENNQNRLTQVKNIVDSQFKGIRNIAYQISRDPDLTPYKTKNNANSGMTIKENLVIYKSTNYFIHELFLYMHGDSFIYSPFSTYTPERLLNNTYSYQDWAQDDFNQALNHSESPTVRPAENVKLVKTNTVEKFITAIVPIPVLDPYPYGTLLFQVKEQMLVELIQGMLGSDSGNSIIMNHEGQIITSVKDADFLHTPNFMQLIKNSHGSLSEKTTLGNTEYLMSVVKSDYTQWSYITLMPTKAVMGQVTKLKWRAMLGLVITLLLGSAVIYYISFKQYNPIKRLKEYAEDKWGSKLGGSNEIEVVRLVVDHLSDNNQILSNQVQNSHSALRDKYLFELLKGQVYSMEELDKRGNELQLSFTKPYFSVVIIGVHTSNRFRKDRFISYIESHLPEGTKGYVKENMDDNTFSLLLSSEFEESQSLKQRLTELRQSISQDLDIQLTAGIGSPYKEPHLIGKSYLEALTTYNYRMILGNNKVICFADISGKVNDLDDYPKQEIERLALALKREDSTKVTEEIGNIIQYIKTGNGSIFVARCLCYDVINTILKSIVEMNSSRVFHKDDYPDVIALLKFETVEELEFEVRRVCQDILQGIKGSHDNRNDDLKSRIVSYIREHYCNPDFSVQQLAGHCAISPSYISRYFKEQSGQSISDYVNQLRIQQAEFLLLGSDESLQSVVHKVGYYDVSSFIRKFKSIAGVTPGEFRKLKKGM